MQHVPGSLWSEQLFKLATSCCTSPGSVGFSPGDIAALETLPRTVSKKKTTNTNSMVVTYVYMHVYAQCACGPAVCVGGRRSEIFWVQFEARSQIISDHGVVSRTLPWKVSLPASRCVWCWDGIWLHFMQFLWFDWSVASWSPWWRPSNQGSCSTWQHHKWVAASTEVRLASTSSNQSCMS
jgi:hypothetical protein